MYEKNIYDEIRDYEEIRKIRKLFTAVLLLAIKDAYQSRSISLKLKKQAGCFLRGNEDLKAVCYMADVDETKIKEIAKEKKFKNKEKYYKIKSILRKNMIL